jgi:hypothetical protein
MRLTFLIPILFAAIARGQTSAPSEILEHHPLASTIAELRSRALAADSFRESGLTKVDYLTLIAANVDFFKQHQDARGAIIDPYDKNERQYSTPAFALDAAIVVRDLKRDDLLEPATRAMSFTIAALANRTTADGHADFYIPLIMHARRILKDRVPAETLATWDEQLRGLVPERTYRDTGANNNWNLVNVCGELLRRQDGLVSQDQLAPQLAYIDKSLASQLKHFTPMGMFTDPNSPLAYDVFPRLWLEDVTADGAYRGLHSEQLWTDLTLGGLTTLLLFSPSGEWPSGGRRRGDRRMQRDSLESRGTERSGWDVQTHRASGAGIDPPLAASQRGTVDREEFCRSSESSWIRRLLVPFAIQPAGDGDARDRPRTGR